MSGYFSTSNRYWSKESKAREFANIDRVFPGPGEKKRKQPTDTLSVRCFI
jgi:hypothetical protein